MRLQGKLAAITGAASGMGKASAISFAREGASVAVIDVNEDAARAVVEEIKAFGGRAFAIQADLLNPDACRQSVRQAVEQLGGLDIFWAHAGIPGTDKVEDITLDEYDFSMSLNLRSSFLTVGEAARHLRQRGGGSILLTASVSGLVGSLLSPLYSASKFGVVGLAKSLALRWGKDGIRVNVVCPGLTDTPMLSQFMSRNGDAAEAEAARTRYMAMIPLRRVAVAQDVANAGLWLASDEASYITGVALPVDGGLTAS